MPHLERRKKILSVAGESKKTQAERKREALAKKRRDAAKRRELAGQDPRRLIGKEIKKRFRGF